MSMHGLWNENASVLGHQYGVGSEVQADEFQERNDRGAYSTCTVRSIFCSIALGIGVSPDSYVRGLLPRDCSCGQCFQHRGLIARLAV